MSQAYYALVTLQAFFSDRLDNRKDRGATAVEYGLMVGLIAVVIIGVVAALGTDLSDMFSGVSEEIDKAATPAGGNNG